MAAAKTLITRVDGTTKELPVLAATIVAFERKFGCSLGDVKKMEHVYWLAWESERRTGAVVKPFETWLDEIAEVEEVQGPEEIRKQIAELEAKLANATAAQADQLPTVGAPSLISSQP